MSGNELSEDACMCEAQIAFQMKMQSTIKQLTNKHILLTTPVVFIMGQSGIYIGLYTRSQSHYHQLQCCMAMCILVYFELLHFSITLQYMY